MYKNEPAIVVIAYNRSDALLRLLRSIEAAKYPEGAKPDLVISIDNGGSDDVKNTARNFSYTHGEKVILERSEHMGLRSHVISCGDLTEKYGSIIVLEDDLFVSPCFYDYVCAALDLCEDDDRIAQISLYDHLFNVHKRESFCAIDDGYDNYYLQLASSWGQAYTKKQWKTFRSWYEDNKDSNPEGPYIPENVSGWSEKSWLKYYIAYLIGNRKYCLYPRVSLTTNFGDVGAHAVKPDNDLQVMIRGAAPSCGWSFSTLDTSKAVYDAFFEPEGVVKDGRAVFGYTQNSNLIVDLYGSKPLEKMITEKTGYILTQAMLPYRTMERFGRCMRPEDANVVYGVSGNDFFLYDIKTEAKAPERPAKALKYLYEYRGISASRMLSMIMYRILEKIGRK